MDPRVKKIWVDALQSGEYRQGFFRLKDADNRYCCLGVLCDLYRKEVGGKWARDTANPHMEFYIFKATSGNGKCTSVLPDAVAKWAGLTSTNPLIDIQCAYCACSFANDAGIDFKKIAEAIERSL